MSQSIAQCPCCFARVPIPAGTTSLSCPSCEHEFTPEGTPVGSAKPRVIARPVASSGDRRPPSRRREEDRRERRRSTADEPAKKRGSAVWLLVAGGGLAVLLLAGIAAVVVTLTNQPPVARGTPPVTPPPTANDRPKVEPPDPDQFLEPKPDPPQPEVPFPEPKKPEPPKFVAPATLPKRPELPFPEPVPPKVDPNPLNPPPPKPELPKPEPVQPKKQPAKYADLLWREIRLAKLDADRVEVMLPGKVGDVCVGGGGRYLFLHLPAEKVLAAFDVSTAKVVKQFPLDDADVLFAAGMNELVLAYPSARTLVRYQLPNWNSTQKEYDLPGPVRHLCLGSASAGPLLVAYEGKGRLAGCHAHFDPATLAEVEVTDADGLSGFGTEQMHYRASPDGTRFGLWTTAARPTSLTVFHVNGRERKRFVQRGESVGHVRPNTDGRVYTGAGMFDGEGKRTDEVKQFVLPAAEGPHYVRLTSSDNKPPHYPLAWPAVTATLTAEVRVFGDSLPLAVVSGLGPFAADAGDFTADKRVHFVPAAEVLVTIPGTNDRLVLNRYDPEATVKATGVDYLFVTSRPSAVPPGVRFEYQMAIKSRMGRVVCTLVTGPKGMTCSPDGRLIWLAPADFKEPVPVSVRVTDASGQEVTHSFDLTPGQSGRLVPATCSVARAAAVAGPIALDPAKAFEIVPPPVRQKAVVALPAAADAACVGGGGRFLIYRLPTRKELAILDVSAGKVVKQLPLDEPDALFAAGMTKLYVGLKSAGKLVRYDLETFEKEATADNPISGTPTLMLLGHRSDGPLYLGGAGVGGRGYGFVHTGTLKEVVIPIDGPGRNGPPPLNPRYRTAGAHGVSPDGRTFSWYDAFGHGLLTVGDRGAEARVDERNADRNLGRLLVGSDGTQYGNSGMFSADFKAMADTVLGSRVGAFVPATSGPWFVAVIGGDKFNTTLPKRRIHVGSTADERVRFPFDQLDGLPPMDVDPFSTKFLQFPVCDRIHLITEAEVLAVLDDALDRVHLHRVPVRELVRRSADDLLVVVSRPPPAVPGTKWAYTPAAWSKKGGITVKVEKGPDGMKADGTTVTWDVPAKLTAPPAVILTVADAGGKEAFHSFTPGVRAAVPPVPVAIKYVAPAVAPAKAFDPPAPLALKPTAAKGGTDLELPGVADSACLAGGGRFILLRIPSKAEVAVFDTVAAKVVKSLPLPEDGSLVAGGADHALVISPKVGLVQRWRLSTLEKEDTVKLPADLTPKLALMGHASNGPLFLAVAGDGTDKSKHKNAFYDPFTLQKLEYVRGKGGAATELTAPVPVLAGRNRDTLCCSPDGRVWATWNKHSSPTGISSWVLDGPLASVHGSSVGAGPVAVGSGGVLFCGAGVATADHTRVLDVTMKGFRDMGNGTPPKLWFDTRDQQPIARTPIPAADGPLYLWFPPPKTFDPKEKPEPPALKILGGAEPLATLKDLRGVFDPDLIGRGVRDTPDGAPVPLFAHQRSFLIPAAGLLAVLSLDGTKLHLHALDCRGLLDASGQDYLLVNGRPPQYAPRGKTWAHTLDVWSKKGGVKVEVIDPPPGLTANGLDLSWDVPADLLDPQLAVECQVSDASGKSVRHVIPLILDAAAAGPFARVSIPAFDPSSIPRPPVVVEPKPPVLPKPTPPELAVKDGPVHAGNHPVPALRATRAKDGTEVPLPGQVDAACLAGGGRYLLLTIPLKKKVAVFDAIEGKVVKELPLYEGGALVAGSRTYAFVVYPAAKVVQRWRLSGFEHEATTRLPDKFAPTAAVMGHAGEGPLLLGSRFPAGDQVNGFYDPLTLKKITLKGDDPKAPLVPNEAFEQNTLTASPDGRTFAWGGTVRSSAGIHSVTLDGDTAKKTSSAGVGVFVRAGADDRLFAATGVFSGDHATVLDAHSPKVTAGDKGIVTPAAVRGQLLEGLCRGAVPAADGPLYLMFPEMNPKAFPPKLDTTPALKVVGVKEPLAQLTTARGMSESDAGQAVIGTDGLVLSGAFGPRVAQRAFLIPSADLLVVIDWFRGSLHLHVVNCRELLNKSDADFLFVSGRPQQYVARNLPWEYTPEVWSKAGKVTVEVVAGPDGLKATAKGAVSWAVPPKWDQPRTRVELKVSDASGKSVTQAFDLIAPEAITSVAPVPPKPPPAKLPEGGVAAAPFDAAWGEYTKRTKLEPATFKGDTAEVPLGSGGHASTTGGGGRYLAVLLAGEKVIRVVDLSAAKVAFEVPFDHQTHTTAANRTGLFVLHTADKTVTRYDLATGKEAKAVKLPAGGEYARLVAAADSDDAPLVVVVKAPTPAFIAYDPATLAELPDVLNLPADVKPEGHPLAMSADGLRLLVPSARDPLETAFHLGTRTGGKYTWVTAAPRQDPGMKYPRIYSLAGNGTVYSHGDAYSPDARAVVPVWEPVSKPIWHHHPGGPLFQVSVWPERDKPSVAAITSGPGQPRLLPPTGDTPYGVGLFYLSEPLGVWTHYNPKAKSLVVRKFDLKKLYADAANPDPLVALDPPPAERGKAFACTPAVLARGETRPALKLDAAPKGMTLTADGRLEWAVPADFPDPFATVTLTATAEDGKKSSLTVFPAVTGERK